MFLEHKNTQLNHFSSISKEANFSVLQDSGHGLRMLPVTGGKCGCATIHAVIACYHLYSLSLILNLSTGAHTLSSYLS
jgi:hypothetical protein